MLYKYYLEQTNLQLISVARSNLNSPHSQCNFIFLIAAIFENFHTKTGRHPLFETSKFCHASLHASLVSTGSKNQMASRPFHSSNQQSKSESKQQTKNSQTVVFFQNQQRKNRKHIKVQRTFSFLYFLELSHANERLRESVTKKE